MPFNKDRSIPCTKRRCIVMYQQDFAVENIVLLFVPWSVRKPTHLNFQTFRDPEGPHQLSSCDSGPKPDTFLLTPLGHYCIHLESRPYRTAHSSGQECLSLHIFLGPLPLFLLVSTVF